MSLNVLLNLHGYSSYVREACLRVCLWLGMNGLCGDGNLLAAYWLPDVEEVGFSSRSGVSVQRDEAESWPLYSYSNDEEDGEREEKDYRNYSREVKSHFEGIGL